MTIDKDGLAPCPLCAAQMLLERFVDWESQPLNVQHIVHPTPTTCPLAGVQIEASTEAIAAWNRRALPNTGDELVARLQKEAALGNNIHSPWPQKILGEAADAIASLTRTRDASRANFLTMQGAAATILKRAQALEAIIHEHGSAKQIRMASALKEVR